ncbi:putative ankyrin repeat protein RF_0381 [Nasonia vitripennis]|uniref:Ankyrin repeat protein n=1 Tax=Nasonia vitripennis TaxID=7425 RepID=A0A7M7QC30_NASVI|nr:putative ankyrin repeat protein RF_0381 [Nasonia vitripennis]
MESLDVIEEVFTAQLQQLRKAVEEGYLAIVNEIFQDDAFKRAFKRSKSRLGEYQLNLLNTAACKYYTEIVEKLISHEITLNVEDKKFPVIQPLWYAIINGRYQIAKILIRAGADVNRRAGDQCHFDYRGTPLHFAAMKRNEDLVELLLAHGAKINACNSRKDTALHYAVHADPRCIPTVRCLLRHGARVDLGSEPVLLLAARLGNLELAKLLIEYGAIASKDASNKSALHHTAQAYYQNTELAMMLLSNGLPVDQRDKWGETPLHEAAKSNNAAIVELLIAQGADVNAKCSFDVTPLFSATARGNTSIVKQLLTKGANPNVITKYGQTAFHLACSKGFAVIVSELLKFEADVNVPTSMDALSPNRAEYDWDIRVMLIKYIVKLQANSKPVSEDFILTLRIKHDKLFSDCQSEIERMKATILHNKVTFFKLLTLPKKGLVALMENKELMKVLDESDIKSLFPIYAQEVTERCEVAKARLKMKCSVEESLNSILHVIIPCEIIRKIMEFFTFEDMQFLLDSS